MQQLLQGARMTPRKKALTDSHCCTRGKEGSSAPTFGAPGRQRSLGILELLHTPCLGLSPTHLGPHPSHTHPFHPGNPKPEKCETNCW